MLRLLGQAVAFASGNVDEVVPRRGRILLFQATPSPISRSTLRPA
ncbi:hypothetical protein N184_25285 [Sinorhizobium sp. GL28]|nr:hypothetical protein N184_25285 [Sinorhizobium sp. GL28]